MKKFTFVLLILLFFSSLISPHIVRSENPVGFDFLRTLVGARPSAMGGAFVAIAGDIHNIAYNPAGLAMINKRQGTLTYLNHLLDFQSGFFAYAHPFANGVFAVGLHFFDFGTFEGKDINGEDTGEFGSNSFSFAVGYSYSPIKNLSVGGMAKYIRFQIDNLTEMAIATDLGIIYSFPSRDLDLGLGVFNLGTTTSAFIETKDALPLSIQLGFAM